MTEKRSRTVRFRVTAADGTGYLWGYYRDHRNPAGWVLVDHEGHKRVLESNWTNSLPRIHQIAQNYGFTCHLW